MSTSYKDYYQTLGVPRTASAKEVKSGFRKLARKYHPDVNQDDPTAVDRFKEINEAHEVLGDPAKRKKYDELGPQWQQYQAWEKAGKPGGGNPFAGFNGGGARPAGGAGQPQYRTVNADELEDLFGSRAPFSDFFNQFFGGAGGPAQPQRQTRRMARRGEDVEGEVTISLDEAHSGASRTVEFTDAAGTRRVEVKIPAGIADGARVRASGQGTRGEASAPSGDLFIKVYIKPHSTLRRDGDDLSARVPVALDIALLGGVITVPRLGGGSVHLTIPAATQNGARLRLRGLGMPRLRGVGNGDLYAEVDVRLPGPLNDAARAAAEQLRDATRG